MNRRWRTGLAGLVLASTLALSAGWTNTAVSTAMSRSVNPRAELLEWAIPLPPQEINLPGAENMITDANGNVWYARSGTETVEGRIGRLEPCTNSFRFWKPSGALADSIRRIALDAQGRLFWIGSTKKPFVARLDPASTEPAANTIVWPLNEVLPGFVPVGTAVDAQGGLWLLNQSGTSAPLLVRFMPEAPEALIHIPHPLLIVLGTKPRAIALDAEGGLWLAETSLSFGRGLARVDPGSATLTEWEIPPQATADRFAGILAVSDGAVWTVFASPQLPVEATTILRLELATSRLTIFQVPLGSASELVLDPETAATVWMRSRSEVARAELTASLTLAVQSKRITLPLVPEEFRGVRGQSVSLKEESLVIQPQSRIVEADSTTAGVQKYPVDLFPQGLQFRGIDLFLSNQGASRLTRLRPLPAGVDSLPPLCATPLQQSVNVGETAAFTLRGAPRACCDRTTHLSVESMEPPTSGSEFKFEPSDILGGIAGITETQLKVKIPKAGRYKITIQGKLDGTGPPVRQVVLLTVKE